MKYLIMLVLFLALEASARERNTTVSITVGHHHTDTIFLANGTIDEIRYLSNNELVGGRVVTSETMKRIKADVDQMFPGKKDNTFCSHPIRIIETIEEGVKERAVCIEGWSLLKHKKFSKLFLKLKDLATSKIPIY